MLLRFKAEHFKGERLQPLQLQDCRRLFDYLDEDGAGVLSLADVATYFVQSGTLGARLQQQLQSKQQQSHMPGPIDTAKLRVPDKEERRVLFSQWDGTGSC